jgi:peptide/nickel transport system ATP-binding protein
MARPGEDLVQIPGTMPSLIDLPKGCAFQPRCGFADAQCATMPALSAGAGRRVRCHHPLAAETVP